MNEGFSNGLRKHGAFGGAALLFKENQRLIEVRIPFRNLLFKNVGLRMLAAQTQYGCADDVGMVEITCDEAA